MVDPNAMHNIEQAAAMMAETVGRYFRELLAQGFTRGEALKLTEQYQGIIVSLGQQQHIEGKKK